MPLQVAFHPSIPCNLQPRTVRLTQVSPLTPLSRLPSRKRQCSHLMSTQTDPLEQRVRDELAADGINLDDLLDSGKVLRLTRELDQLTSSQSQLATDTAPYQELQQKIDAVQSRLVVEKRQVMQAWLKRLFVAQSVVFGAIGGVLAYDAVPGQHLPLVAQAFGFWLIWLFTIPSLRARKGTPKWEKSALNYAFLVTPLLNLILPFATKNCGLLWTADVVALLLCYAYFFLTAANAPDTDGGKSPKQKARITGILRYLDWGSWR